MLLRVAIVADRALRMRISEMLKPLDIVSEDFGKGRVSLRELLDRSVDLVVVQMGQTGDRLLSAVRVLKQPGEAPGIVVVTDREDPDKRAALLAQGCEAVLFLGLTDEVLRGAVEAIVKRRQEVSSLMLADSPPTFRPKLTDFASESASMKALIDMAERVVNSDTSLLILGETGVGKEWLARAIHIKSNRPDGAFVAVNCAALPEQLLESELFGHEAGAFTGATRARRGAFEMAHRGTIFLDEIGEMPFHLQVKLLRVLQDHCIQRIGAEKTTLLDVRVMAASNRDLLEAVKCKAFRQDLFYRLSVVTLTVPPLRERHEDIAAIAEHYLRHFSHRMGRHIESISDEVMEAIEKYHWPGNVRELINVMERAVLLCQHSQITTEHLPSTIAQNATSVSCANVLLSTDGKPLFRLPEDWLALPWPVMKKRVIDQLEKEYVESLLKETKGHMGMAASRAGMNARSLYSIMQRLSLRKEFFKTKSE